MHPLNLAAPLAALFLCANLFSGTVALRLLLLIAMLVLVAVAAWKRRGEIEWLPPAWLPFLLWGAWAALSILWSIEPSRSAKELQNEIVYTALAYFACFVIAQAPRAHVLIAPIAAAGAFSVCAVSVWYFSQGFFAYAQGPHGGPGNHAAAVLTMMPCALLAAWVGHRQRWHPVARAAPILLVAVLLFSAYATFNRTVWVGLVLQLLVLAVWASYRRARLTRGFVIAAASAAAAMIAAVAAMLAHVQSSRMEILRQTGVDNDPRLALWEAVLALIEERPLTGYGFGRGLLRAALGPRFGNLDLWHSHNLVLDAALQVGFVGLGLLVALLAVLLARAWTRAKSADEVASACGIAIVCVIAGMLVRNMTDVLWVRHNALLFWGLLGILFAWGSRIRHAR